MKIKSIHIKKLAISILTVAAFLVSMAGQASALVDNPPADPPSYNWINKTTITAKNFDGNTTTGVKNFNFVCTGNFGALTCTGGSGTGACPPTIAIGDDTNTGTVTSSTGGVSNGRCTTTATNSITIGATEKGPTNPSGDGGDGTNTTNTATPCTSTSECICPVGSDPSCGQDPALSQCKSQTDCNIVTKYLNPFIKFLSILFGIAVVIGLVSGGIQYSASGGDPQKVSSAKKHIRNSILALLVYLFLYAGLKFLIPGGDTITG